MNEICNHGTMYQARRRKDFSPWKAEFRVVIVYWIMAAVWLGAALAWCIRDPNLTSEAIAESAVLPLFFGFLHLDSARRRRHGSAVEKRAVQRFIAAAPPSWAVEADLLLEGLGNADLLVTFPNGRRCPIEIKSWRSSANWLRMSRGLRQVQRQRDRLPAQNGVLWLPEAPLRRSLYRGGILLVEGDAHFLVARLSGLKYRFVVQFPQAPPRAMRERLMGIALHGDPRAASAGTDAAPRPTCSRCAPVWKRCTAPYGCREPL